MAEEDTPIRIDQIEVPSNISSLMFMFVSIEVSIDTPHHLQF